MQNPTIEAINGDSELEIKLLNDESIDIICIDPPYLYLKNQKLEREFDEVQFFEQCKRVLTKNGFVILFGRGTSFYRWNTILADLGFTFKEEIVWNKIHCTSPLLNISRVHETVSIYTKGKGTIKKVKIPYLEMKIHDLDAIITDVKRLKTTFKNTKSLNNILTFLENNNKQDFTQSDEMGNKSQLRNGKCNEQDRCVSVINSITKGYNEKSIIRTGFIEAETFTKFAVNADKRKKGDRCVDVMQSVDFGLNEKTIIKQVRDHYSAIHPTQKPVRLLERLIQLVLPKDKPREEVVIADFFAGSFSCGEACFNLGVNFIGFEIDEEYYQGGKNRMESLTDVAQKNLIKN